MYSKVVKYVDFRGVEREEEFLFNLSKAELVELNLSTEGGLDNLINKITKTIDTPKLIELFKKIMLMSYGEISPDGRRFIKNDELTQAFTQTEAYSIIFMELVSNDVEAAKFVNGIVPSDLREQIAEMQKNGELNAVKPATDNTIELVR